METEKRDQEPAESNAKGESGIAQEEKCKCPSLGRVDEEENSAKFVRSQLRLLFKSPWHKTNSRVLGGAAGRHLENSGLGWLLCLWECRVKYLLTFLDVT